jgi:hypothetical protein
MLPLDGRSVPIWGIAGRLKSSSSKLRFAIDNPIFNQYINRTHTRGRVAVLTAVPPSSFVLKMEAGRLSKTVANIYQTSRRH